MVDEPAAIRATFSDFRLIKGRKQAQLVLEVPIEEADAALSVLGGIPQPHSDRWVAVARLNGVAKPEPEPKKGVAYGEFAQVVENAYYKTHPEEKGKRKWDDLDYSTQAGMMCDKPAFWKFLEESHHLNAAGNEEEAAELVRAICGVDSRLELNSNPRAAAKWTALEATYQAWLKVAE